MTDLNALLQDFKDKRLAYKEINRAAHEALMDGIVAEIEALKAEQDRTVMMAFGQGVASATAYDPLLPRGAIGSGGLNQAEVDAHLAEAERRGLKPKRGPGRPPKDAEALNG